MILSRAAAKQKLTEVCIEGGQFSSSGVGDAADSDGGSSGGGGGGAAAAAPSQAAAAAAAAGDGHLSALVKYGAAHILDLGAAVGANALPDDAVFTELLGGTADGGIWLDPLLVVNGEDGDGDADGSSTAVTAADAAGLAKGAASAASMHLFKGTDYQTERKEADQRSLDVAAAKALHAAAQPHAPIENRLRSAKRGRSDYGDDGNGYGGASTFGADDALDKVRRKAKLERQAKREARQAELWKAMDYVSAKLPLPTPSSSDGDDDANNGVLRFVDGDATQPRMPASGAPVIILQAVDNCGDWGSGGLFTALDKVSSAFKEQYELAGAAGDLHQGDVHCIQASSKVYACLVVCQKRVKGRLSGLLLPHLQTGLACIASFALAKGATVHMPRLGHASKTFDWYACERTIRRHLAEQVDTSVYYYRRRSRGGGRSSSGGSGGGGSSGSGRSSSGGGGGGGGAAAAAAVQVSPPGSAPVLAPGQLLQSLDTADVALPSGLVGVRTLVDDSLPDLVAKKVTRIVLAWGGTIVDNPDVATHIVAPDNMVRGGPCVYTVEDFVKFAIRKNNEKTKALA